MALQCTDFLYYVILRVTWLCDNFAISLQTAFCDQHSPPDHIPGAMYAHSDEDSGPPSAERAAQIQKARMRQARKILAERRNSTPAVSMPIVQKARLKAIHEKLMKELNTECHSFLEDLYRFWTLKRQQRNGVPLLRRLQVNKKRKLLL